MGQGGGCVHMIPHALCTRGRGWGEPWTCKSCSVMVDRLQTRLSIGRSGEVPPDFLLVANKAIMHPLYRSHTAMPYFWDNMEKVGILTLMHSQRTDVCPATGGGGPGVVVHKPSVAQDGLGPHPLASRRRPAPGWPLPAVQA